MTFYLNDFCGTDVHDFKSLIRYAFITVFSFTHFFPETTTLFYECFFFYQPITLTKPKHTYNLRKKKYIDLSVTNDIVQSIILLSMHVNFFFYC